MEIEYGAEVIDRNGKVLGTVDHLMRNTWTGDISKFVVRRKSPDSDLFFSTGDVSEAANGKVKLSISVNEVT
jgi:sporulation protein YlmC with PRC-barrel domain